MKFKKIRIIPTKKNIETQYKYLVKETGQLLSTTRLLIYYNTLFTLNDKENLKSLSINQLEILKNKKMVKIKIYEVNI